MTDDELNRLLDALKQQTAAINAETRQYLGETRQYFDETARQLTTENRRHFDVSTEAVKHEVRLVAEAVAHVDERLARETNRLDEKIDGGFADTQAMIKFSHAELERRLRTLEQAFSDLQNRVERLEATAH
jgi:hypothetical protein